MVILVTGGSGFIGSCFIRCFLQENDAAAVVNLDKLTYAAKGDNLADIEEDPRYTFIQGCITNSPLVQELLKRYQPQAIIHFAAESHVDRSIHEPGSFVQTNVVGTATLLQEALNYWKKLSLREQQNFRFIHISTDEVYGTLKQNAPSSTEESPFAPNSPYAASKASADCFARAYYQTFHLPVIITRSSNNYGPYQFPEKLIPLTILNGLMGRPIPIYGNGEQRRSWLFVEDHCKALLTILEKGLVGSCYNIATGEEESNLSIVYAVCQSLERQKKEPLRAPPSSLITFVKDRPGHDTRYSLSAAKLQNELDWQPATSLKVGIDKTVKWYLDNQQWLTPLVDEGYREWISCHYGGAL